MGGQTPPGVSPPIPNPMQLILAYQQEVQKWQQQKQQLIMSAIDLLRQDKLRGFRIDIETDSTINDSAKEEKMERVEFMTSLSGFVEKAMQAAQSYPDMIPLLGKSILFTVRGFRVGRDLESTIEEFIDKAQADAKKAASMPKPPSPEQIKAQADIAMSQANLQEAQLKMQGDRERAQAEVQAQQVEAASEKQNAEMRLQQMQMEMQLKQLEYQLRQKEMENKLSFEQMAHQQKMHQLEFEFKAKMADHAAEQRSREMDAAVEAHTAEVEAAAREHEIRTDAVAREHETQVKAAATSHQAELKAHDAKLKMRDKYPRKPLPKTPKIPKQPEMPDSPLKNKSSSTENPPHPAARKAPDGKWYINDPSRPGKYLRVEK